MLRNREVRIFLISVIIISFIGTGFAFFISPFASLAVLLTACILFIAQIMFTRWRYREIEKLSGYLRMITSGNYSLDVRDNEEGELSILKNDIYKVTSKLSEHSQGLEKDKSQLTDAISDISHQLKTPLTSMMVMADLLNDPNLSIEKRTEFTRHMREQLERLEWLVSSLLKLSKIDAGTVQFKKEQVNMKTLIEASFDSLLIPLELKNVTVNICGDETASFVGDFNWTKEAVINLLKNAVEHTKTGGLITIKFLENALYSEITIQDNGVGIDKADLPYIFKRFYKGKNAAEGSVGIGLAMAYSIITKQKGDVEVKSARGEGTTFSIKLYKQVV